MDDETTSKRPLILTLSAVLVFLAAAGTLIVLSGATYGFTFFIFVPFVAGLICGLTLTSASAATAILLTCFGLAALLLLVTGLEGIICILMVLPLLIATGGAGLLLATLVARGKRQSGGPGATIIVVAFGLLLTAFSAIAENKLVRAVPEESVESILIVPHPTEKVWKALLSFTELPESKPFLLRIGLPVPTYCTLESEAQGAKRICYFDIGEIEQVISTWEPPTLLEVEVTNVTLPGNAWLRFLDAAYELEESPDGTTTVRRTTRYHTVLRPRLYWRPLERIAIQAEHRYVLSALESKLAEAAR